MNNILLLVLVSIISLTGCSKETSSIEITHSKKAEVIENVDYVERMKLVLEETVGNDSNRSTGGNKYDAKYINSEVYEEAWYGGDRDRIADYVKGISKFRTQDESINELHDELISTSIELHDLYESMIDLGYEEAEDILEHFDKKDTVEEMIESKSQEMVYILEDISVSVGVDLLK